MSTSPAKPFSRNEVPAVLPCMDVKAPRGLKVLVAGSDLENRWSLATLLAECGAEPLHASSVHEAMGLLAVHDISVVFCSTELSDGTCRDFFRALGLARWKVPVVLTAHVGGWEEYLHAMELGAYDFMVPPYRRIEIIRIVHEALGAASRLSA